MPGQPLAHLRMLVDCVIVDDGVDFLSHRDLRLDGIEEADKLLMAMALHVAADDAAVEDVVRRLGFSKADTKLILDHAEGRTRDTTDEHYDWEQSLIQKYTILCAWEKLVHASSLDIAPSDESESSSDYVDTSGFGMSSDVIVPGK